MHITKGIIKSKDFPVYILKLKKIFCFVKSTHNLIGVSIILQCDSHGPMSHETFSHTILPCKDKKYIFQKDIIHPIIFPVWTETFIFGQLCSLKYIVWKDFVMSLLYFEGKIFLSICLFHIFISILFAKVLSVTWALKW